MAYLDGVKDIADLGQRKLVVLWGKSNTGKTEFGSTWPKPQLYVQVGDDGSNTIRNKKDISGLRADNLESVKGVLRELIKEKGAGYESVFVDTFSMVTNVWIDENVVKKKKKMTQQMWGDLKTETEELIRLAYKLSLYTWVILSCHEAMDAIEGMEDEILPDARPSTTKGARTYLEGMANYGFHTTRLKKEVVEDGTKLQTPKEVKVPAVMINPSFAKLSKLGLMGGEKDG